MVTTAVPADPVNPEVKCRRSSLAVEYSLCDVGRGKGLLHLVDGSGR